MPDWQKRVIRLGWCDELLAQDHGCCQSSRRRVMPWSFVVSSRLRCGWKTPHAESSGAPVIRRLNLKADSSDCDLRNGHVENSWK